jgi:uncharacterized protein YdeI (YjbR/CyaY-like superfamily)
MSSTISTSDLLLPDINAWRVYLDQHEDEVDSVWLVLAKKGTKEPTSITYDEALEEALCSGWIDGQRQSRDAATFKQRFSPRRRASLWSRRNVGLVHDLIEAGRMRPRGHAEVDRAREDGRWDRAYAGAADVTVPDDLRAALDGSRKAQSVFSAMTAAQRYTVLYRVVTAPTASSRANRIVKAVESLERTAESSTSSGKATEKGSKPIKPNRTTRDH